MSVKAKDGWASSLHQKPTGPPVVVASAGLELTIAPRLRFLGLTGLGSFRLIGAVLFGFGTGVPDHREDEIAAMTPLHRQLDPEHAERLQQPCGDQRPGVDGLGSQL